MSLRNMIERLSPGYIATVAGTGWSAGSEAAAVGVGWPMGVVADDAGDLIVAEYFGHRIFRIDRAGRLHSSPVTGSPASKAMADRRARRVSTGRMICGATRRETSFSATSETPGSAGSMPRPASSRPSPVADAGGAAATAAWRWRPSWTLPPGWRPTWRETLHRRRVWQHRAPGR